MTRTQVLSAAANGKNGHTLISDAKFRQLYETTLQLTLLARRKNGNGWLRGRIAAVAGVAADLRADDVVVSDADTAMTAAVRELLPDGVCLAAGAGARGFAEQVVTAVSGAAADRMRKSGRLTVILSGGAAGGAAMREARALAGDARLPVLFVETQPERNGRASNENGGANVLPVVPVDAEDVIALYRVAHESMERARGGDGPTVIACRRWPALMASGRKTTRGGAAIDQLEQWLASRGLPAQEWCRAILTNAEKRAGQADDGLQPADEEGAAVGRTETASAAPQTLA